ncbi:LytR family transcriptional regulator, partial [Bacillus mojavensis]|nr:LytR family transcriptional regulator [Bacillus mojavensis]
MVVESIQLTGYDYKPGGVYYFRLNQENLQEVKEELQNDLGV